MTAGEKARVRTHFQAWQLSQFLHGEQGALVCTAKIVQQVPTIDAKFYAATQVVDEARHVEAYSRLLHEKFDLVYPINPHLKQLLDDTLADSRWDFTYLGMQVLIEGVALAAFGLIRDQATNPLAQSVTAYVMQDEARHVAFGRLALRDYYPQLTDKERDEREEFIVEGCYLLRDRFLAEEVWETLGLPGRGVQAPHRPVGDAPDVSHEPLHPHRADHQGHRPVGPAHPEGVRRHGHPRLRRRRPRRARTARRGDRARDGSPPARTSSRSPRWP